MVTHCLLFYIIVICCLVHLPSSAQAQQLNNEVTLLGPKSGPSPSSANATIYAWTTWGKWSPCSRTCGGGVSVQERQCLPRPASSRWRRSRRRRKLSPNPGTPRNRRDILRAPSDDTHCPGLAKRYHECNTKPCPGGGHRGSREEQCASYDRRPFRGRFYTWVPYVDGDAPCILNCRPRGHQFYASLGLAADGTPCTRPGFRAICVQGSCKVVGREGVLSTSADRDLRCGRKLVTGLFSKPRLPLGYSYVTTVPRGACRLNITEMVASDNYIALKVLNGSYIINGEFAVSAPGAYEAVGARFHYTRGAGLDTIFSHGPIQSAVDIMILYTQPNPNIRYEYLSDATQEETNNEIPQVPIETPQERPVARHHRHHLGEAQGRTLTSFRDQRADISRTSSDQPHDETNVIGDRKFTWKILSFTPCSRTCGGGLQIGKFRCVESTGREDREVAPAYCKGSPPPSRRRRCGGVPCSPRWRAAPWGPCPVCGPAQRTRIVGCVQDHAKGITKVSDQKCSLPMPPSSEPCNIPNCDDTSSSTETPRSDSRRQIRTGENIEEFRGGPVTTLQSNKTSPRSLQESSFTFSAAGGWLYTEWSECVGWCVGGGIQSRGVRCADPAGCAPRSAPRETETCSLRKQCDPHEGQWFTGEWSKCSAICGGREVRGILCIGGTGRRLKEAACKSPKPESERACGGNCSPSWYLSDWGECQGPCESGIQTRTVWCAKGGVEGAGGAAKDSECPGTRPLAKKNCVPARCSTKAAVMTPVVIDSQQRVTRHQNRNVDIRERSFTDGSKVCEDKLSNCNLAVQARLCRYHYYSEYCCRSCHTQRT